MYYRKTATEKDVHFTCMPDEMKNEVAAHDKITRRSATGEDATDVDRSAFCLISCMFACNEAMCNDLQNLFAHHAP